MYGGLLYRLIQPRALFTLFYASLPFSHLHRPEPYLFDGSHLAPGWLERSRQADVSPPPEVALPPI